MKSLILSLLVVLTAASAHAPAFADGVPFIFAAPALSASDIERLAGIRAQPEIKSVTPIGVDVRALDSQVITVSLNGKTYRLEKDQRAHADGVGVWAGPAAAATIVRNGERFGGRITIDGRHFGLGSNGRLAWLVESHPRVVID